MEDFDEAEEQNEEDLLELGDSFGSINLKVSRLKMTKHSLKRNNCATESRARHAKRIHC